MKQATDTLLFDPNDPREFRKFLALFLSSSKHTSTMRFIVDSAYAYTKIVPHKLTGDCETFPNTTDARLAEVSMTDAHYIIERYEIDNPEWF